MRHLLIFVLLSCAVVQSTATRLPLFGFNTNGGSIAGDGNVGDIAAPTDAPTEAPTDAPTEAPTEVPIAYTIHDGRCTMDWGDGKGGLILDGVFVNGPSPLTKTGAAALCQAPDCAAISVQKSESDSISLYEYFKNANGGDGGNPPSAYFKGGEECWVFA